LAELDSLKLWRSLVRFLRWSRAQEAEDVASESILRLVQNLRDGQQVLNLDAYARQIARNVLLEERRRTRRDIQFRSSALPAMAGPSTDRAEALSRCMERCMKSCLSEQEIRLIEAYYGGDAVSHIAQRKALREKLGLSENALRLKAFRVRQKLQECIKRCPEAGGLLK
jgi:DNA-directed RNA polymerase specialized sigma24 family protein